MKNRLLHELKDFTQRRRNVLLLALIFFIFSCVLTWPFILHPTSTQASAYYGDVMGSITKFDALKNEGSNPFTASQLSTLAYPNTIYSNSGVDRVSFLSTSFLWILTLAVNATFAHSMYVFLGYFLTSFVVALFILNYTKSTILSVFGGFIVSCFPLFISLALAAPVYMWMWLYLLPIWAFVELSKRPTRKRLILTCLSILPGIFWTPYFMLHTLLIALSSAIIYSAIRYRQFHSIPYRHIFAFVISALVTCAAYIALGFSSSGSSVPVRTTAEAYDQSLHPLMLVLPTAHTVWSHPIYNTTIKPLMPRSNETVLYAGLSVTVLTVIGVYVLVRKRRILSRDLRLAGVFCLGAVLISLAFSLAPTISPFGVKIPTPNYFVVHFVPALRAGQRLVGPAMLGISVLSVIGIWYLSRTTTKVRPVILYLFIAVVVAADYFIILEKPVSPTHTSVAMSILATSPRGVVAEYFNDSLIGYPGQLACKNYLIHHQTMVNTCGLDVKAAPGSWPVIEAIAKQTHAEQLVSLHSYNVRYIISDKSNPKINALVEELAYPVVARDDRFVVYELPRRVN